MGPGGLGGPEPVFLGTKDYLPAFHPCRHNAGVPVPAPGLPTEPV